MRTGAEQLLHEFAALQEQIRQADEIVLYGKTDVFAVVQAALNALKITVPARLFYAGRFADGKKIDPALKRVVILCGMRASTRESMQKEAAVFFPKAPCFDYLALYYDWLLHSVKRDCDAQELAQTLLAVRAERTIHNIDSINTTFCTLNCKECSNGMQYRKNKKYIPVDRHIQSLYQLTKLLPISYCNLQGGEPLLDKELAARIRLHAQNPRIAFLTLATNGTLVPSDEVMQAMREAGLMLRISDYGALSKQKFQLMRKAEEFSVPCILYPRSEFWVACGKLETHGRAPQANRVISQSCHFGTKSLMLYDGCLFCCCRTLFADTVKPRGGESAVMNNCLDLFHPFTMEELQAIISGKNLYQMCDFCDYPMQVIAVAEQLHRI